MDIMDSALRQHIAEVFGGDGSWEAVTAIMWKDDVPFQIWKFEQDVEYQGKWYRCLIISKDVFDPDDLEAVDYTEDIYSDAWIR